MYPPLLNSPMSVEWAVPFRIIESFSSKSILWTSIPETTTDDPMAIADPPPTPLKYQIINLNKINKFNYRFKIADHWPDIIFQLPDLCIIWYLPAASCYHRTIRQADTNMAINGLVSRVMNRISDKWVPKINNGKKKRRSYSGWAGSPIHPKSVYISAPFGIIVSSQS